MVKEIIAWIFVLGGLWIVLWLCIDLTQPTSSKKKKWKESCPENPIISFEKFKTLYELDKSRWTLNRDYVVFTDNNKHHTSLGMTYKDYLKYKKYYKYLNKKHATADAELKQKNFEDTLDKYLESKISKIQNDLRKNTEELKRRTEDYKSDFDCVNKEMEDLYRKSECSSWIEDTEIGKIMHIRKGTVSIYDIKSIHEQGYIIMLEKEEVK